ncbi:hypothetical protein HYH02_000334 [Chlamydomonas schloesseri]|uniref:BTB domain-containing protein n=1 Tax=Chlamydomonas schloesseri TaxID=2026947 RepID=A0A835WMA1_9CHLO|nr:hypothetical protein HYH02_000334 [Chlamydomonas schloesseri]|eukprot:KAG2450237.1 hypothetical protein HYH02_000334 [Chlamydomonas schloesseri]
MHSVDSIPRCAVVSSKGEEQLVSFVLRPVQTADGNTYVEVVVTIGDELFTLERSVSPVRGAFSLSDALSLFAAPASDGQPWPTSDRGGRYAQPAAWDAWSAATYFVYRNTVVRLTGDEVVLVAGRMDEKGDADGTGEEARFMCDWIGQLASTGDGNLFYIDSKKIRRIQLPEAWRATAAAAAGAAEAAAGAPGSGGGGHADRGSGRARRRVPAAAAAAAAGAADPDQDQDQEEEALAGARAVRVSTLDYTAPEVLFSLAFVPAAAAGGEAGAHGGSGGAGGASGSGSGSGVRTRSAAATAGGAGHGDGAIGLGPGPCLVFGTNTALYHLPLPLAAAGGGGGPGMAAAGAAATTPLHPQLLAGLEGRKGMVDARGREARLGIFSGITVDAARNIYLIDNHTNGRVRRVSPDGTLTTLVTNLPQDYWWPAILPCGFLALGSFRGKALLLDLGLKPLLPQLPGSAAAAGAGADVVAAAAAQSAGAVGAVLRSLQSDLAALLEQDGADGTSDLTVRVGKRRFFVHRGILSARCDYFKQRLARRDAFVDAGAAELDLPDADPDAFGLLLRWLYTGAVGIPLEQARGVAELADRLLLPELCASALSTLATAVTVHNIVDALLWAHACHEAHGGSSAGPSSGTAAAGCPFGRLRQQLVHWYAEHHKQVAEEAGESCRRLQEAPGLAVELLGTVAKVEAQQQRGQQQQQQRAQQQQHRGVRKRGRA